MTLNFCYSSSKCCDYTLQLCEDIMNDSIPLNSNGPSEVVRYPEDTAPELPGTHSSLGKRQVQNWECHGENPRLIHTSLVDLPHLRDKLPPESGPSKELKGRHSPNYAMRNSCPETTQNGKPCVNRQEGDDSLQAGPAHLLFIIGKCIFAYGDDVHPGVVPLLPDLFQFWIILMLVGIQLYMY